MKSHRPHSLFSRLFTGLLLCALLAQTESLHADDVNYTNTRQGGMAIKLAATKVSSTYTATKSDQLILADPTAAAFTITLPPLERGRVLTIVNITATGNAVTLDPPGSTTISGSSTYTLSGTNQSVTLHSYSDTWYAVAERNAARVQAVTATTTGATTGTILPGTTQATVTSDSADKIVILPAPVVGKQIVIHNGATGYELRTSDPATIAINAGTGTNAESAIAANSTCVLICVTTTAWKGYFLDADSDVAKIQAAAP